MTNPPDSRGNDPWSDEDKRGVMSKKYHIYAYKHFWPAGGIDKYDTPVPYEKDRRKYIIEANSEKEAIKKAEAEYGSAQRVGKDGKYTDNADGSWTVMGVSKVEL